MQHNDNDVRACAVYSVQRFDTVARCRFETYQPDLVVSVHPLMQHVPLRILHRRIRNGQMDPINFATVVTDFTTCSNLWFSKRVTKCFVPTEFCANRARCASSGALA